MSDDLWRTTYVQRWSPIEPDEVEMAEAIRARLAESLDRPFTLAVPYADREGYRQEWA